MKAWMRQESKDFRLVFIQDESTSKEEQLAIKYAIRFSEVLGLGNRVVVVNSIEDAPKAKMTRILKDTSEVFEDKLEILKLKTKKQKEAIDQTIVKVVDSNIAKSSSTNSKEEVKAIKV